MTNKIASHAHKTICLMFCDTKLNWVLFYML